MRLKIDGKVEIFERTADTVTYDVWVARDNGNRIRFTKTINILGAEDIIAECERDAEVSVAQMICNQPTKEMPMPNTSYTHFDSDQLANHEWAKEVRARLADLNELLQEAAARDVIVTGNVAMFAGLYCGGENHLKPLPTVDLTISERI